MASIRDSPDFIEFARDQWDKHPDFWRAEAQFAPHGLFKTLAVAICEIADAASGEYLQYTLRGQHEQNVETRE